MRGVVIWLAAGCAIGGVACAQTLPDGPLAASPSQGETHAPRKATFKKHAAKPHAPAPSAARDPNAPARAPAMPTAAAGAAAADDPLSFGMKWNGSNDNGVQTRTQNYNGNAAGTGAEVGMKLHF